MNAVTPLPLPLDGPGRVLGGVVALDVDVELALVEGQRRPEVVLHRVAVSVLKAAQLQGEAEGEGDQVGRAFRMQHLRETLSFESHYNIIFISPFPK